MSFSLILTPKSKYFYTFSTNKKDLEPQLFVVMMCHFSNESNDKIKMFYFFQTGPLLQCSYMSHVACDGCWSPTRPSVFYIARKDGTIDVWDVLDKTHEPFLSQNITPFCITSIVPIEFSRK